MNPIFSSFRAEKEVGVHLPLAAPEVIHIWLLQSQLFNNKEHAIDSQNDLVNSVGKKMYKE